MKVFLTFICMVTSIIGYGQTKITSLSDDRIPGKISKELISKLKSITDPENLEAFSYKKKISEADAKDPAVIITFSIDIYFKEGNITGDFLVTRSKVGYTSSTVSTDVDAEICYLYCCTSKIKGKDVERCSEKYKEFKKWKEEDGCSSSKTTACDN